ncbi:MAG: PRC-barrel domain-containing protein [Pseudomonadota bacterium]|nr:PRC-barrel domain-containing protein [Pseudomonadota bacterium]
MVYRMRDLLGLTVTNDDGTVGNIENIHFDDHRWVARYMVVKTGEWLMGRKVLISPISVSHINWRARTMQITLSQHQIDECPQTNTDVPASRLQEIVLSEHYGYPDYFTGGLQWGTTPNPELAGDRPTPNASAVTSYKPKVAHLRSLMSVIGYDMQANDEGIGPLEDFLVDKRSWEMLYAVVDTSDGWPGKKVVIPPMWIDHLDGRERKGYFDVARNKVAFAPDYDPRIALTRGYEAALYEHYARPGLWT